jgi:hypothetical protein
METRNRTGWAVLALIIAVVAVVWFWDGGGPADVLPPSVSVANVTSSEGKLAFDLKVDHKEQAGTKITITVSAPGRADSTHEGTLQKTTYKRSFKIDCKGSGELDVEVQVKDGSRGSASAKVDCEE